MDFWGASRKLRAAASLLMIYNWTRLLRGTFIERKMVIRTNLWPVCGADRARVRASVSHTHPRTNVCTLVEEQSTFSIYGWTRSIHRDGTRRKRCARVYKSEIAGNLRGLRVISQWLQNIVLQYYTAVVARVHGQRTLLHGRAGRARARVWVRGGGDGGEEDLVWARCCCSCWVSPSVNYFVYDRCAIVVLLEQVPGPWYVGWWTWRTPEHSAPSRLCLSCFKTITNWL